jgi:lipoprotein-anchoring transpeptidase ErfK/SrfK
MFFHGGYAFHGSNEIPGYNASHGCVRIFSEDARWLNQEFIDLPEEGGTKVIIQEYPQSANTE